MSDSTKPLVFVFGATGRTGKVIVQGLLDSGAFRVAASSRSADRPEVRQWTAAGVQVHILDSTTASAAELEAALRGVDILVSTGPGQDLELQRPFFIAAAAVGVKRVVPSAFGPSTPRGVMVLHDQKLEVLEYIKSLGLNWTWINIGWWTQLVFPIPADAPPPTAPLALLLRSQNLKFYGDGTVPYAVTDLYDVGRITARILQDEGTKNRFVFAYGEEVTQHGVWELAKQFSPEGEGLEARKEYIPHDTIRQLAEQAINPEDPLEKKAPVMVAQYANTIFVRGDNVASKAKELGELVFNELYPDFKLTSLRESAERYYRERIYDVV